MIEVITALILGQADLTAKLDVGTQKEPLPAPKIEMVITEAIDPRMLGFGMKMPEPPYIETGPKDIYKFVFRQGIIYGQVKQSNGKEF